MNLGVSSVVQYLAHRHSLTPPPLRGACLRGNITPLQQSAEYRRIAVLAAVCMVAYVVLIPLGACMLLVRNHAQLGVERFRACRGPAALALPAAAEGVDSF